MIAKKVRSGCSARQMKLRTTNSAAVTIQAAVIHGMSVCRTSRAITSGNLLSSSIAVHATTISSRRDDWLTAAGVAAATGAIAGSFMEISLMLRSGRVRDGHW